MIDPTPFELSWGPLELVDEDAEERLEKAQRGEDVKPGRFRAIASVESPDRDDEIVVQSGLDWGFFERNGHINYEHKKGPPFIIGYPLGVVHGQHEGHAATFVDGALYLDKPLAREVYETAISMKRAGGHRQLGVSVEGIRGTIRREVGPDGRQRVVAGVVKNLTVTDHPMHDLTRLDLLKSLEAGHVTPSSGGGAMSALTPQSIGAGGAGAATTDVAHAARRGLSVDDLVTLVRRKLGVSEERARAILRRLLRA